MCVRLLPFRVMPRPSSRPPPGPPPSLPQAQAPPPSHSLAGRLACTSLAGPFTILYLLPCSSRSVPATLVLSAPKRGPCGNPLMTLSAPNSPSPSPAPEVPLCLPKAPSSGADSLAARRLGMARPVGDRQPEGQLRAKRARGQAGQPDSPVCWDDHRPGERCKARAEGRAGRTAPGAAGGAGPSGGGRGRGGGIPRRRRPARPLALTPP